jgi:hypothetical protein
MACAIASAHWQVEARWRGRSIIVKPGAIEVLPVSQAPGAARDRRDADSADKSQGLMRLDHCAVV